MSDPNISPNMNLPIPVTSTTVGPSWANDYNNSLSLVDAHNHAPGSGVQINPNGLYINADLPYNSNNAISLRSVRFTTQAAPLALASDKGCLYESGVDLYYNDGSGNQIRITQSGSVAGSAGTITGLPSGTASAAFQSSSGTFQFLQATSTGANIDAATYVLRYPGSYPTPSGNYIALQAPSGLATGYAFTLPATLPSASGAFLTASTTGVVSYTNVDNSTLEISSSTIRVKALGVAAAQMANATITGTQVSSNINLPGSAVQENGKNLVVSNTNATNSLAVIRGKLLIRVNGSNQITDVSIAAGEGFSVASFTTNTVTITITSAFGESDYPILVSNSLGATPPQPTVISSSSFSIGYVIGGPTNFYSNFMAISQRS